MDMMELRRRVMMLMASGIVLPSNVEVKTFTIESDMQGSSNFSIDNPFGRTNISNILCINFFANAPTGNGNNRCVGFILTPSTAGDNRSNRKLVYFPERGCIEFADYMAIQQMTSETITLRNTGTYNWLAGTYYMFVW